MDGFRRITLLLPGLLLVAACGSSEPAPLKPTQPAVPDDLCASIAESARTGLTPSSSTTTTGTPTAACSLSSPGGASPVVHGVVTVTHYDDPGVAGDVFDTQCRAMNPQEYAVSQGYTAEGADKACAGKGKSTDTSTFAAVRGKDVLTVRVSSQPTGNPDAFTRGAQLLEGALGGLPGPSPTSSSS